MKALHRVLPLTLLVLTSCGIPATGVVEAGGPASGTLPITPVYFVRDGGLVAMPRTTELPGDPAAALRLLLAGPMSGEGRSGEDVSTEIPALPTSMAPPPASADATGQPSPDGPTVTVNGDAMSIRLPADTGPLSGVAVRQVVCTAAAAYRFTRPSADPVTAEVVYGGGRGVRGSDEGCPGL
ncbi:hypothetical protein OHT57_06910 [Streptomyces sp. NBC_00285]|uniref:hypothetical protein n=1 Tax=Streptomyces sp. NBC_00285 TaxID=2975700 RepID=UPI002E2C36D0|nr:hypothetical protein [Streptomyces sp. NBC_00285]